LRKLDAADAEETVALLREMIAAVDAEQRSSAGPGRPAEPA
jgi:hypothetical protein